MQRKRRGGLADVHSGQVAVNAHLRSWVAGVLDNGLTLQVWGRTKPHGGIVRAMVLTPGVSFAEELQRILGMGTVVTRVKTTYIRLHPREAMALYLQVGPYMRGPARGLLRVAASWAHTLQRKGYGGVMAEGMVERRRALLDEADRIRSAGKARIITEIDADKEDANDNGQERVGG